MRKILQYVILFICVVTLIISGVELALIFMEYRDGVKEYENLGQYIKTDASPVEAEEGEAEGFYFPDIDFASLREKNGDFVCWIVLPALDISYPVVQGKDNEEYLYRTFEGAVNSSGCLFLDSENTPDFSDRNSFIYGHNMKNRSMFGSLKLLTQDEELIEENPYFYIYTENAAVRYRIIGYYPTVDASAAYRMIGTDEEYDSYLNQMLRSSSYAGYEKSMTEARPDLVTLSTCHGKAGGTGRFVVHGAVDEIRSWEEKE